MHGHEGIWWLGGWWALFLLVVIIGAVVFLIGYMINQDRTGEKATPREEDDPNNQEIRYARGEIDKDRFERNQKDMKG
jgi:uncharacterized membrane protein